MGSLVKKLAAEGMLLGVDNFTAKEKENPQTEHAEGAAAATMPGLAFDS